MRIENLPEGVMVRDIGDFNLARTLACGQAFRWCAAGEGFEGIAGGLSLRVSQRGDLMLFHCSRTEFDTLWRNYFDLDSDYAKMWRSLICCDPNLQGLDTLGIRILRQQPFEALISFILSANNHIPRIQGIIRRLCESLGEAIDGGYAFPAPAALAGAGETALRALGAGYRARYVVGTAARVAEGFPLHSLARLPYGEARTQLMTLPGVGGKVADCVLLYGLGHLEAFPVDVWMRRAMGGARGAEQITGCAMEQYGAYAGVAQQSIFWRQRSLSRG